ncbi:DNA protecting protein DprA [Rarobacter faecitabidus]|uniref:DNA protecting protein DprA n=2 Tax=Rarobacter faecitabidus TaxID=13243 RepID=A0A542ZWR9_RARFA|nr:DNA protecting protein DprA [Rarobacter faecitabidus]
MSWAMVTEPGEIRAIALVQQLGAMDSWEWLREQGHRLESGGNHHVPASLRRSVKRWYEHARTIDLPGVHRAIESVGARTLVPGDSGWPVKLDDLADEAPLCLWVRGNPDLGAVSRSAVAIVGARAATAYGVGRAGEMSADLASQGIAVVSGGAFGIDAAAHRGALGVGGPTIAFLAGGIDQFYPRANAAMLAAICERGGAVVSELGPGAQPLRSRFLKRNRLIAALGDATVVVEAGLRSGAMSTARQASSLVRPLGAVPGPVTSRVSAGCHELIRSGMAVLVSRAQHIVELVRPFGDLAASDADIVMAGVQGELREPQESAPTWLTDAMDVVRSALRARRRGVSIDEIVEVTGLATNTSLAVLGELEARGEATWRGRGWELIDSSR